MQQPLEVPRCEQNLKESDLLTQDGDNVTDSRLDGILDPHSIRMRGKLARRFLPQLRLTGKEGITKVCQPSRNIKELLKRAQRCLTANL